MSTLLGKRVLEQWHVDFLPKQSQMTDAKARRKLRKKGCTVFRFDDDFDIERNHIIRRVTGYVVE